jgi:hypothetical protein
LDIPASHNTEKYNLPPVTALIFANGESGRKITVTQGLDEWLKQDNSNLLILMGGLGTGKTTCLKDALSSLEPPFEYIYFDQIVALNKGVEVQVIEKVKIEDNVIVIIDNFDAVNSLAGFQITPPDLRMEQGVGTKKRLISLILLSARCVAFLELNGDATARKRTLF